MNFLQQLCARASRRYVVVVDLSLPVLRHWLLDEPFRRSPCFCVRASNRYVVITSLSLSDRRHCLLDELFAAASICVLLVNPSSSFSSSPLYAGQSYL
ncbi:hypothetical protein Sjap_017869 [Stephania japonica]|uniref:Uncharacterized protein n=1 Tax=Stephania japonica TaxID=461633 RepID=A0AAP0NKG6_9MAGN